MTPKLPACTPRDVERALSAIGFRFDHQTGSHRTLWRPVDGRRVTVAMHSRDLKRRTLRTIIKQAGLTPAEFHNLLLGRRGRAA